jgi:hypothetical protein
MSPELPAEKLEFRKLGVTAQRLLYPLYNRLTWNKVIFFTFG